MLARLFDFFLLAGRGNCTGRLMILGARAGQSGIARTEAMGSIDNKMKVLHFPNESAH